jgi:DNA-binding beta-propeller fold protein YncE
LSSIKEKIFMKEIIVEKTFMEKIFIKKAFMIIVLIIAMQVISIDALASNHYVIDEKNKNIKVPLPLTYEVKKVIRDIDDEISLIKGAEDLFIDERNLLYVVDTGNNRVIKMDREGTVMGIYKGPEEKQLVNPKGIYVDTDCDMYIADTGNYRILHLSPDGDFVEEFERPNTELVGETFTFDPEKIFIDSIGNIYVIKGYTLAILDAYNNFRGFMMGEKLPFSFTEAMINLFASKEQKERIARRAPPPYSNLVIDGKGIIYATAVYTDRRQIQKINSIGNNIYADKFFGEMVIDEEGKANPPYFVDLAVDKNGIISALEQQSGKIYQYDQEGNLLTVFGGKGKRKGYFDMPTSIEVDDEGNIYVLDSTLNNLQVFEPTMFMKLVHEATTEYGEGRYEQSFYLWEQVLKINENYQLAHKGKAKALMKQERWKEAMEEYKFAQDQEGYSNAFSEYRHYIFRKYFGWVVLISMIVVAAIYLIIKYFKIGMNNMMDKFIYGKGVK